MVTKKEVNHVEHTDLHIYGTAFLVASIVIILFTIIYSLMNPVTQTGIHILFYLLVVVMLIWGIYLIKNY